MEHLIILTEMVTWLMETGETTQNLLTQPISVIFLHLVFVTHHKLQDLRDSYKEYFCNEGSVPWQYEIGIS